MITRLKGGKIYDPANRVNGQVRDIYIQDGRIVRKPRPSEKINKTIDLNGKIVMAGGIDIHTHIGGGKANIARMLLPEDHLQHHHEANTKLRSGSGHVTPTTHTTGYRYAEMGYTSCFEPAMLPVNARQAHMEMSDTPIVDTGAYSLLGNDDFLLRMIREKKSQKQINDYVAWIMHASQAMAVKIVNPGGINAFKFNQRKLELDDTGSYYELSPRKILKTLARSLHELGVPHPLHVHGCNLGVPGNVDTTLNTIEAMAGLPIHLTHVQFHSYGTEGDRKFSSGAAHIAEALNDNENISMDVGQIMFGQTVTASGDSMHQYAARKHAHPNKWVCMDIECDAGCGVVPFRYRDKNFVNALQWCIGLEIFLLAKDPWRVFLTTDHPNGAPFTMYPHLIRLLMDRSFRNDMLSSISKSAQSASILGSIEREYSLYEIATMTRAAPARSLGIKDRGHLGVSACADIAIYQEHDNKEKMFERPAFVFKDGHLVVKNGKVVKSIQGSNHVVKPDFDKKIEKQLAAYFDRYQTMSMGNFKISDDEVQSYGNKTLVTHDCHNR